MRLTLRVKQAAEFVSRVEVEITQAIANGSLATRKVPGVAGPHVHAIELVAVFNVPSADILRAFGRFTDADVLDEALSDGPPQGPGA